MAIIDKDLAAGPIDEGSYGDFDQIFAGDTPPPVTRDDVIASGQGVVPKGSVVARLTSGGKLVKHNPAGSGGAEVAVGITTQTVDATSADTNVAIYIGGCFNAAALTWNSATNTKALKRLAFGDRSPIVIEEVVKMPS